MNGTLIAQSTGEGLVALGGLAGMIAVVKKLTDFAKLVTNLPTTTSAVVSQLLAWLLGIGATFVYAASNVYGSTVQFGDTGQSLATADTATKLIIGVAVGSVGSLVVDWQKARDNNDTAKMPPLPVGPTPPIDSPAAAPAQPGSVVAANPDSPVYIPGDVAPPPPEFVALPADENDTGKPSAALLPPDTF